MLPRLSRAVILHPLRSDWDVSLHLVQVHQPSRRSARRCFMNKIGAERYNNEYKIILRGTMGSLHAQNSNFSLLMGWCWLEWLLSERSIVQLSKFTILVPESIINIPWPLISTLFDVWNLRGAIWWWLRTEGTLTLKLRCRRISSKSNSIYESFIAIDLQALEGLCSLTCVRVRTTWPWLIRFGRVLLAGNLLDQEYDWSPSSAYLWSARLFTSNPTLTT